jgi:hypothetical protein
MAGDVMAEAHKLIVGARGWDHAGWHDTFYPEDLPEDWRLSYYANEFAGVLLPEALWRVTGPETISGWCDDVPDDFLFFLESLGGHASDRLAAVYRDLFGTHWGGVPVTGESLMSADEKWDLRRLRERFGVIAAQSKGVSGVQGFFLYGDPPDINHLREARLLADMLS